MAEALYHPGNLGQRASNASVCVIAILMVALGNSAFAQGIRLGTHGLVSFATEEAARQILTNRDDFIRARRDSSPKGSPFSPDMTWKV